MPTRRGSRPKGSCTWTCTPTTSSPATTAPSLESSTGRARAPAIPASILVRFAYDLDGHDQPVWDVVEATGIEPRVLRAYVAHHALRCTSWQIHNHTDDVSRQLDRAERVLDRYEA